jgi:hypothetical protein
LSADFLLPGRLPRSMMPARAAIESGAAFQCKLCCKTLTMAPACRHYKRSSAAPLSDWKDA